MNGQLSRDWLHDCLRCYRTIIISHTGNINCPAGNAEHNLLDFTIDDELEIN
jgi:hypothetical protein